MSTTSDPSALAKPTPEEAKLLQWIEQEIYDTEDQDHKLQLLKLYQKTLQDQLTGRVAAMQALAALDKTRGGTGTGRRKPSIPPEAFAELDEPAEEVTPAPAPRRSPGRTGARASAQRPA